MNALRESPAAAWLERVLETRLDGAALDWLRNTTAEVAGGLDDERFCALFSSAARRARSRPLGLEGEELSQAAHLVPGWRPERWTRLMALRARLLLAHPELDREGGARVVEEAFRYADEGELCALYASLCLLPGPERFVWRAGEGCRTNMLDVFEAVACDTPYPVNHFDDVAWRQLAIKSVFVGAPLWRVVGLDGRLDAELARMALDLADERRSAGRPVQPDLWLCLGSHGGERALAAIDVELAGGPPAGRAAAGYALARASERERLERARTGENDPRVREHLERALAGRSDQVVFGELAALTD